MFGRVWQAVLRQPRAAKRGWDLGRFRAEFGTCFETGRPERVPRSICEELFEWIDFLEAVEQASGTFRFVEVGAGYGRWSVRALKAAEQRNLVDAKAIAVEAEPIHGEWLVRHMRANCIGTDRYRLVRGAVGATAGKQYFVVSAPDAALNASTWYGQALATAAAPLDVILADELVIDLIDLDVQGAEAEFVETSAAFLKQRAKRLHIGTHSHE